MARMIVFLIKSLFLILIILIFLELGVRLWGYSEHYIYDPIYRESDKIKDMPYIHKSNLLNARGRGLAIVNTDSLGLRSETTGIKYSLKKEMSIGL